MKLSEFTETKMTFKKDCVRLKDAVDSQVQNMQLSSADAAFKRAKALNHWRSAEGGERGGAGPVAVDTGWPHCGGSGGGGAVVTDPACLGT